MLACNREPDLGSPRAPAELQRARRCAADARSGCSASPVRWSVPSPGAWGRGSWPAGPCWPANARAAARARGDAAA